MKTLTIYNQTDNNDFYMASYNDEEALNLAFNGTVFDAINEALEFWGLDKDEINIETPDFFKEMTIPTISAKLYYVAVRPSSDYSIIEEVYANVTTKDEFPFLDLHDEKFAINTVYTLCKKSDKEKEIKQRLFNSLSKDFSIFGANFSELQDRLSSAFDLSSEEVARYFVKNNNKYSLKQIEDQLIEIGKNKARRN